MADTIRSLGYLCPQCGKSCIAQRSAFSLQAAAQTVDCACEKTALRIEQDGERFLLEVPCGFCGKTHRAEVPAHAILEGRGVGLSCPQSGQLCAYIGEPNRVYTAMAELERVVEKEKAEQTEAFTDNVIMYEVLSELKEIAARPQGISCRCGSTRYTVQVRTAAVDLICQDCGAKLRIGAATDRDLDDLCCHMKLRIPGAER